jgi:hypothetical protein
MSESNRVAVAAHLHLMMRRRLGRVTDVEWMATNRDYALEMVRLCRQAAPDAELHDWAEKLALSYGRDVAAVAARTTATAAATVTVDEGPESTFANSRPMTRAAASAEPKTRYVASLR